MKNNFDRLGPNATVEELQRSGVFLIQHRDKYEPVSPHLYTLHQCPDCDDTLEMRGEDLWCPSCNQRVEVVQDENIKERKWEVVPDHTPDIVDDSNESDQDPMNTFERQQGREDIFADVLRAMLSRRMNPYLIFEILKASGQLPDLINALVFYEYVEIHPRRQEATTASAVDDEEDDNEAVVITHEDLVSPSMTIRDRLLHAKRFQYPIVAILSCLIPTAYEGIVLEVSDKQCRLEREDGKCEFTLNIADIGSVSLGNYDDDVPQGSDNDRASVITEQDIEDHITRIFRTGASEEPDEAHAGQWAR